MRDMEHSPSYSLNLQKMVHTLLRHRFPIKIDVNHKKIFENCGSLLKLTCPVRCGFETVHCAEVRPNKRLLKFSYSSLSKRNYPHKTYAFIQKMKN